MIPARNQQGQPPLPPQYPLAVWPYRLWLAVLHHLAIMRTHAATPERALWWDALGRTLDGEVAHD